MNVPMMKSLVMMKTGFLADGRFFGGGHLGNNGDPFGGTRCFSIRTSIARLLRMIQLLDGADKKAAKDRLLELFALVDPADPRVIKARAALANALF